jgi:hypothetical protein
VSSSFESNQVIVRNLKLCGILDGNHSLASIDVRAEGVQGGRFS